MALSQQPQYETMQPPATQRQSISNEGNQGYPSDGPYGNYGLQAAQQDPGWIQRVLEEMKDMLLLLNAQGHITYASPSAKQITGRSPKQLEGSPITQHIHEDDQAVFHRDMDDSVALNRPFRTHVRFSKTNSGYCLVELNGHPHIASVDSSRNTSPQDRCTGFFLVCRPHPSKNSLLLDSFLEHKIENARLVQQIAKLKQEEEEEANTARVPYGKMDNDQALIDSANVQAMLSDPESSETAAVLSDDSDPSEGADFFDQVPEAEGPMAHVNGIEIMTGLFYGDGERSQGLSTGARRGRLVHCDIDITTTEDQARNLQEGDRRKRLKGQHVCSDCGTADSPEWRKGPNGPKTLCNACGLRWSKKEKKRQEP
ncbi:hypothetical protein N7466_004432 [Penicillium verhagenii]|uniref:uncharacterized protein n=1 Tax=Penicillium verhagenii TaxID=1562060 RepID=UPI0025457C71|nr:uncharacterized protein N7466_004432 [Penicillium verhagenii]KAJ5934885.1 hypothetical protein N7466_004432 [Penicillium verhagenii]